MKYFTPCMWCAAKVEVWCCMCGVECASCANKTSEEKEAEKDKARARNTRITGIGAERFLRLGNMWMGEHENRWRPNSIQL